MNKQFCYESKYVRSPIDAKLRVNGARCERMQALASHERVNRWVILASTHGTTSTHLMDAGFLSLSYWSGRQLRRNPTHNCGARRRLVKSSCSEVVSVGKHLSSHLNEKGYKRIDSRNNTNSVHMSTDRTDRSIVSLRYILVPSSSPRKYTQKRPTRSKFPIWLYFHRPRDCEQQRNESG